MFKKGTKRAKKSRYQWRWYLQVPLTLCITIYCTLYMHPFDEVEDAWASYDNYEKSLTIELEGVDPSPYISTSNYNYNRQLWQTIMALMRELEGMDPSPHISLASSSHPDIAEWVNLVRVISLWRIKINKKQDHLRMNNSTGSNNHFRSTDLFRSMII